MTHPSQDRGPQATPVLRPVGQDPRDPQVVVRAGAELDLAPGQGMFDGQCRSVHIRVERVLRSVPGWQDDAWVWVEGVARVDGAPPARWQIALPVKARPSGGAEERPPTGTAS